MRFYHFRFAYCFGSEGIAFRKPLRAFEESSAPTLITGWEQSLLGLAFGAAWASLHTQDSTPQGICGICTPLFSLYPLDPPGRGLPVGLAWPPRKRASEKEVFLPGTRPLSDLTKTDQAFPLQKGRGTGIGTPLWRRCPGGELSRMGFSSLMCQGEGSPRWFSACRAQGTQMALGWDALSRLGSSH